ncbi:MAG TPA: LamG-like jellyroll fold domain-containing protein [Verrucomicrobiae bacterium]|nr:LamG-like jellyroll fold domain-containing protein [Verrucomicrobiae bacterium]
MKLLQPLRSVIPKRIALLLIVLAATSHPAIAGSINRYIYYNSGTTVSNLTGDIYFPSAPSAELQLDDFNLDHGVPVYGFQSKNDSVDFGALGVGSYTIGYLEAPTNGNYTFYIASANASQLWLSTNETTTGIQLIAQETNSGAALFTGPRLNQRASAPVSLVGGKKYYLQVLQQANSASASYVKVGWQRPDGVQEVIPTLHLAQYPVDLYGGETYTVPVLNPFGLNGGDLPATTATNEGSTLILQVDAIAAQPTTFKWYRNGTLLPGQNLSYLQFSPVHAVDNSAVFQVVINNSFGAVTSSPTTFAITPDITPPTVTLVDARGNPNGVRVTCSEPVAPAAATNLSNYSLQVQGGSSLVITSATLLPDQQSVQLAGPFNFQLGTTYQLTASGIQDQATVPNTLSPNPTVSTFVYAPSSGVTYNFNDGTTNSFNLYGSATLTANGSYDGSGYLDLTDPAQYEKGVIQFTNRGTVDQFHLKFKTRISGGSATPGDGFSVNLAADLPAGNFLQEQNGYAPLTSPSANRLEVAFNNDRTVSGVVSPAIIVKWQGNIVTNVLAGTGGIPSINSLDGHWANVDLQLKRGGNLSLGYDGVLIFTNLSTAFVPVPNAQLEIAAQTGVNYESHWFDDININYADGDIGPVAFGSNPSLTGVTVPENATANFSVIPVGAGPFTYQWYFNGSLLTNALGAVLSVVGTPSTAGSYYVVLSNEFSQTNSASATLSVTPDTTAPHLVSARGLAAGINQAVLTFSEPLDLFTATNLATYNLGFLPLNSATLSSDGLTVTLSTGTLERNQIYLFSINGLKDRSVAGNPLTVSASFATTVDYAAQIGLDGSVRYWRFDEPAGSSTVASATTGSDASSLGVATFNGSPTLGEPSLIPSEPIDNSILLTAATGDWLLAPNGADINITAGPWFNKSFEFWFNANSVPAPGSTDLAAAATIYEQGSNNRGLAFYLWRDPANPNPDTAQLIFHGWNNVAADGAGSPWGALTGTTTPAVYAQAPIQAGQTYHVVGVFAGNAATNGTLTLYVNGVAVSTVGGVGELYNHSGDNEIGRGNTLIHTSSSGNALNGVTANFDGVLDDLSLYDTALSSNTVALHYQAGLNAPASPGAPAVSRVDTLGNPNQILVTFNKAVSQSTAASAGNYVLKNAAGTVLTITNAKLLGGDSTVQLLGNFGFLVGSNYTLTVSGITDLALPPNTLSPNPTNVAFSFSAPAGTVYSFNSGLPSGVEVFGTTYATNAGSYDGTGFLDLTDAGTNQNGALLFTDRHDISQAHITFKTRLSDGSTSPGAGFSVNLGSDLPTATFTTPEKGYLVAGANRLVVSFNNQSNIPPSISVLWNGQSLTNVLTGTNGIPPLASTDGHWASVDINLLFTGLISVRYDGVTVITNLPTGFTPLIGAQVGFGARTTATAYETHWFDDIYLNFAEGSIGPVTIPDGGQPQGSTNLENQVVNLLVTPAGAAPFGYQWYYTNAPLAGATNRTLTFIAHTNVTGAYYAKVFNGFSSATSAVVNVSVQTDLSPATLTGAVAYGGTVNQVVLSFNKLLSPASATNLSTYSFTSSGVGPALYNASLTASGNTVILFTGPQQNLQTNLLTVNGILNVAAFPHALYTNVTLQTGVSYVQEALADGPVRYVRFDETNGAAASSDISVIDSLATAAGTYNNGVTLGLAPLIPNSVGNAIRLNAASNNYVSFPATEKDISSGTFSNRTVEFWFKANTLPYAQTDGNGNVTNNHAPPLWIEGAGSRYLAVYLYGTDSTTTNPSTALLAINGGNLIAKDGPGGLWGATNFGAAFAVFASVTVTTNQVYHVVAQLHGTPNYSDGQLLLYTNGVLGGSATGAGYVYGHTGAAIRVGLGSGAYRHDGVAFSTADYFDGYYDDLTVYNSVLSPARIAVHYQAALTPPLVPRAVPVAAPPVIGSYSISAGSLSISWSGTAQLQRATNIAGPFTTVPGAASPYYEPATNGQAFFRLIQ